MFQFGTGTLWATPIAGNMAANPTPMKFATLQDVSLDISTDLKDLYGTKQVAEEIARGKMKITGKAKWANVNGKLFSDIFFGQNLNPATGMRQAIIDEPTVVAAAAYLVTQAATFFQDLGVRYAANNLPLTAVSANPAVGQYSVNTGTGAYTFAAGDVGAVVLISYSYTAATSGMTLHITNQLMGFQPKFRCMLAQIYNNKQQNVLLYSCVASKLTIATKQEDFVIPEMDFQAQADPAGNVIDIYDQE